jgi:ABC-type transport system involved in multi-copper enzyme maturation permease subunit
VSGRVLSGAAASAGIARVTWTRAVRSRALLGAVLLAAIPLAMAVIFRALGERHWRGVIEISHASAAVLAALVIAGPIGEEFEDRTMTYLWSRPLPRWSVITGKLVALAPLAALLMAGGLVLALREAGGEPAGATERAATALALGMLARAAVAAAIATLVPRQALALTIAYLFFFDLPLAAIPARLQVATIWFHEDAIAGIELGEGATAGVIGMLAIAAIFLGIALWRVRRIE